DGEVNVAVEAALCKDGFVEQGKGGGDQAVKRCRQREDPKRRRPQGLDESEAGFRSWGAAVPAALVFFFTRRAAGTAAPQEKKTHRRRGDQDVPDSRPQVAPTDFPHL